MASDAGSRRKEHRRLSTMTNAATTRSALSIMRSFALTVSGHKGACAILGNLPQL